LQKFVTHSPADDSAVYYLGRLRADAPEYPGLDAALARLAGASLDAARDALAAKQLDAARRQIDTVTALGIESPELSVLEAQYTAAERATSAAKAAPTYATLVRRKYVAPDYPPPAERPYGSPELGSHYQGQTAATESRYGRAVR